MALGPVMRILNRRMRPAAGRSYQPGTSLELLPAASLPRDLSWASGDPVTEDAFARGCAAVDAAGARSVPPSVRGLVMTELENWHGERRGPSRPRQRYHRHSPRRHLSRQCCVGRSR